MKWPGEIENVETVLYKHDDPKELAIVLTDGLGRPDHAFDIAPSRLSLQYRCRLAEYDIYLSFRDPRLRLIMRF